MRVLVTGGGGYIGSVLVPLLLKREYKVSILDNFTWGIKPILHFAAHPNLQIIGGDIRDREVLTRAVGRAETVIHLAAIVGYPACAADPDRATSTNVAGTRNIVEAISDQKLIFASTGSTYGKVQGICTEETPIDPLTHYGSTKWTGERMVTGRGGIALRFATVYGVSPRLRLDLLVNDFVYQAVHNRQIVLYEGHFRRTFLHVLDAAKSYLFALDHYDKMRGGAFNVGDNAMNYTKREVAELIRRQVEFYLHEADVGEDLDKRDYEVSYEKIQRLGYSTSIAMEEGIAELIKVLRHLKIVSEWRNV
jgi:nucleoside-diphosphate-sugar epimerase